MCPPNLSVKASDAHLCAFVCFLALCGCCAAFISLRVYEISQLARRRPNIKCRHMSMNAAIDKAVKCGSGQTCTTRKKYIISFVLSTQDTATKLLRLLTLGLYTFTCTADNALSFVHPCKIIIH
eukprot:m.22585 g.22585  ORF g.22585 m.22585 type:complete len:124 (+) comp8401_c0_seq2:5509-5880(+)